ncbi:energy-coupling factor transporter transmembrane protein EcfT [Aminipila butyrica]|uniref:Energy-coupling factor transporter transmembrane protein EcfT n=1 Tax=Aminipila butyrica TaxID=433296 RepID=A0A858BWF2_9FIRM|nr:energy-coupling factor transporter transmembrane component T [Aminipila butyrica]QIB70411.1 energy-coupling factor transporter transmembrane protein EcfT [Aminipila butyrica]
MNRIKHKGFDPRIGMILIVLSVVIVFSHPEVYTEWILMGSIFICMWLFDMRKAMVNLLVSYAFLFAIQLLLIPRVHVTLASILSIFIYFKMILPCSAMVALFVGTTPVRVLLEAFRRMHVPLPVSIAAVVSARYFPALKDDTLAIWGAMRLRNIKRLEQKVESLYVPLLMSAVNTGEELARSAVTRGIENPASKTSYITIKFRLRDALALLYFGGLTAFTIIRG